MRFGSPKNPENAEPPAQIDTSKRYDIYCREHHEKNLVVYRNAIFKGRPMLMNTNQFDFMSEYLQIEQDNGQTVYLSRMSVVKFCEHGGAFDGEELK